jgi:hypothetical protein
VAVIDIAGGRRAVAYNDHPESMLAMMAEEFVGRAVRVKAGRFELANGY